MRSKIYILFSVKKKIPQVHNEIGAISENFATILTAISSDFAFSTCSWLSQVIVNYYQSILIVFVVFAGSCGRMYGW
jgi:hypothetical protein